MTTWSFAPAPTRGRRTPGAGGTRTFTIHRTPGAPPPIGAGGDRSIFGEAGKQLLKVIAFPVGDAAGELANSYLAASGSESTSAMASATS